MHSFIHSTSTNDTIVWWRLWREAKENEATAPKLAGSVGQIRQGARWLKARAKCDNCYREGTKGRGGRGECEHGEARKAYWRRRYKTQNRPEGQNFDRGTCEEQFVGASGGNSSVNVKTIELSGLTGDQDSLCVAFPIDEISGDSRCFPASTHMLTRFPGLVLDQPPISMNTPTSTPQSHMRQLIPTPSHQLPLPPTSVPILLPTCQTPSQIGNGSKGTKSIATEAKSLQGTWKWQSALKPLIPGEKTEIWTWHLSAEPFSGFPTALGPKIKIHNRVHQAWPLPPSPAPHSPHLFSPPPGLCSAKEASKILLLFPTPHHQKPSVLSSNTYSSLCPELVPL